MPEPLPEGNPVPIPHAQNPRPTKFCTVYYTYKPVYDVILNRNVWVKVVVGRSCYYGYQV